MKNTSTKVLASIVFALIAIPQVAFASWWNPFSWNISIFNGMQKTQEQRVWGATTTPSTNAKIIPPKKEAVRPQVTPSTSAKKAVNVVPTTKPSVPPTISDINNEQSKPQIQDQQPVITETWAQQEIRDFAYANARGWTSITSTNSLGEKRYYRKENGIWVQKNSETEIQQTFVPPPTSEELNAYNKVCREVPDFCKDPKAYSAYLTNLSFRELTNGLIRKYNVEMSSQAQIRAQQARAAQQQQLKCLMAITPEDERVLDPATQDYLRKMRCGTVTSADKTNYELSKLNSKISDLEYQLKSNQTVSPSLINEMPKPSATNKWGVQWTGDGAGFITNSSGGTTYFQCDHLLGRCFSL